MRGVLGTVNVTAKHEHYTPPWPDLPPSADFFRYQNSVNPDAAIVPSHLVIEEYLKAFGEDYRYQTAPHPVAALESRDCDDTRVGRSPTETADAELWCAPCRTPKKGYRKTSPLRSRSGF